MPRIRRNYAITDITPQYPIYLDQRGPDNFTVTYGLQVKRNLDYRSAALELGACIMHALACEDRLDNRTREEARSE